MKQNTKWQLFLPVGIAFITVLTIFIFVVRKEHSVAFGILLWGSIFLLCYYVRPKSKIHKILLVDLHKKGKLTVCLICIMEILLCTLPMGISPTWNGKSAGHRNQYEIMAESLLHGHIYMDYDDIDPRLEEMENPYDPNEREKLNVVCHDDHAYYKGHYYMYFGIVPVVTLFLPYRVITGNALVTYHATQLFVAFAIIGIFLLFYELAKVFFPKVTVVIYTCLAVIFSVMSIWYSIGCPALYCTAITAGVCMEIWSLYFFVRAVWIEEKENKQILYAFFGAGFGALVFGCRPPIGLANLLVIPMLLVYLRRKSISLRLVGKLAAAALPYMIIAGLLMLYNYLRFENSFEFGQSYQLTLADQHNYGDFKERVVWNNLVNGIVENLISFRSVSRSFPFVSYGGAVVNFPIFMLAICGLSQETVWKKVKAINMTFFLAVLSAMPIVITAADVIWSPFIFERYRMDIYFLMGIFCFIVAGLWGTSVSVKHQNIFSSIIAYLSVITAMKIFLLYTVPHDGNPTKYFPELLGEIEKVVLFWRR